MSRDRRAPPPLPEPRTPSVGEYEETGDIGRGMHRSASSSSSLSGRSVPPLPPRSGDQPVPKGIKGNKPPPAAPQPLEEYLDIQEDEHIPQEYAEIPADKLGMYEEPNGLENSGEYEEPTDAPKGDYYVEPVDNSHRLSPPTGAPPQLPRATMQQGSNAYPSSTPKHPFPAAGGGKQPLFSQNTLGKAITKLRKVPNARDVVQPPSSSQIHEPVEYSETDGDIVNNTKNLSVQERIKRMGSQDAPPPLKPPRIPSVTSIDPPAAEEGGLGWSAAGHRGSLASSNSSDSEPSNHGTGGVVMRNAQQDSVKGQPLPDTPQDNLQHYCWFFGDVTRQRAEERILTDPRDGNYLIRYSKTDAASPYALDVWFKNKVYHLNIRRRPDQKYALGKPKPDEQSFSSIVELVSYHHDSTITLSTKGTITGQTVLKDSPQKLQF